MAKNKTLRTREAGVIVEQVCYQRISSTDSQKARGIKQKATTEAMAKYNRKTSLRKFELMLAANFKPGDIVGVVTYDDEHLPADRKTAERRFRYFRQKLAAHYKRHGVELVCFWSTEHKHGDGRWHHHFVIPSTGNDYAAIRAAWAYGSDVELKPLRVDKDKNYATLAAYHAKESRERLGLRSWSYTRNAAKPVEETDRVDSSYQLQAPKGVQVLERTSIETPFGSFQYLKYLRPMGFAQRPYVRRRRRKG